MADLPEITTSEVLGVEMALTEQAIERRRRIVGLDAEDVARIASIADTVRSQADEFTSAFFDYLTFLDEGRAAFSNPALAARARQLKKQHLVAMVQGDYGTGYAAQRLELALLYGTVGLDVRVFLAALHHLLKAIGLSIMKHFEHAPLTGFDALRLKCPFAVKLPTRLR